jgi:hypothetical protein
MLDVLSDSRAKGKRGVRRGPGPDGVVRNWIPTYCTNCGKPDGEVSDTEVLSVVCLCNACVEKYGVPAGLALSPAHVWRERIAEATEGMTPQAIVAKLDDPNSLLTKLATDVRLAAARM